MLIKDNFSFFLGDPNGQYTLTGFKIGSVNLQFSSENFFNTYRYIASTNKLEEIIDNSRSTIGVSKDIHKIFKSKVITCIVRDPYQRLRSGIIEEIISPHVENRYKGIYNLSSSNKIIKYWVTNFFSSGDMEKASNYLDFQMSKDLAKVFFNTEVFQEELVNWLSDVLIVYWKSFILNAHCEQYFEPLFKMIDSGTIKKYNIEELSNVRWKHTETRHSNSIFFSAFNRAVNKAMNKDSTFKKDYTLFMNTEYSFHSKLLEL